MPVLKPRLHPQRPVKQPKRCKLRPSESPHLFAAMPI
jgi:hypothetical protein